jgi:hypothetical protein
MKLFESVGPTLSTRVDVVGPCFVCVFSVIRDGMSSFKSFFSYLVLR